MSFVAEESTNKKSEKSFIAYVILSSQEILFSIYKYIAEFESMSSSSYHEYIIPRGEPYGKGII